MNSARGHYSHIVIGAGAIGSAAAYWLAERGAERVLVLEQFDLMNSFGSSGDHSRIIRHAYHSSTYTALTHAMFECWRHIEAMSGLPLYLRTGGLDLARAGTAGEAELDAYRAAMDANGIAYDSLTAEQIGERYPQWQVSGDEVGLFQADGGLLDIRKSVSAHTSLALARGVEFRPRTRVTAITLESDSVVVQAAGETFRAGGLVVAVASWLPELMADLTLTYPLTLAQEQVTYFASAALGDFVPGKFPIWLYHGEQAGDFYGFPVYGEAAVKIGRDLRGRSITGAERSFSGDAAEDAVLGGFLERHLPAALGPVLTNRTCLYDLPPDRDFVLDTIPGHAHVAVFSGGGHAGKFASLVGQILADLLIAGTTSQPIEAFRLDRPALTDPAYRPVFADRMALR